MMLASRGILGDRIIDPFLRMARGENALNELNRSLGMWVHGDGWGAIYENEGRLDVVRSTRPCWNDPNLDALRTARIFLLHARRASHGAVTLGNTHPFEYGIDGARWFFCHNGTIRDSLPIAPSLKKTVSTDSEKLFHLLLPHIAGGRALEGIRAVYGAMVDFTCLNSFLFSSSACWAISQFSENPSYYALSYVESEGGLVFSSEPLHEFSGTWKIIPNGSAVYVERETGRHERLSIR